MIDIQRRQAREKKESERHMALQSRKMIGFIKPKYFRPNELIHNASNFNRLPIDKQYIRNSKNMVNEAVLK